MPLFACFRGQAVQPKTAQDTEPPVQHTASVQSEANKPAKNQIPICQVPLQTNEARGVASAAESVFLPQARDNYVNLVHLLSNLEGGWCSALLEACQATCECLDADHACIYVLNSSDLWAAVAACAGLGETAVAGRAYSCDPRVNASAASAIHRELDQDHPIVFRSLPTTSALTNSSASAPLATAPGEGIAQTTTAASNSGANSADTTCAGASTSSGRAPEDLPGDWQLLYEEHGCRQFAAVALRNAAGELLGVLSLAAKGPVRPAGWTLELLHSVVGLLAGPLRRAQAVLASPPLSQLHSASTFSEMVQAVAEAAAEAASAVAFVRGSSRVAVIHADMNAAAIFQQQQPQSEGEPQVSVPLLRARRSSCEFVLLPSALRKSVTTNTLARMSMDELACGTAGMGERGGAAPHPTDALKWPDSWGANRMTNASFTLSFPRGPPCKGHTLSLDRTLLSEAMSKHVAGLCIDDCQTHTVSKKAYPRDLLLSRTAMMPTSLALATIAADGKPLMALYVTFATALAKPLLQAVVQELQQLLQAILPTVRSKFGGVLAAEYAHLGQQLESAVNGSNKSRLGGGDTPDRALTSHVSSNPAQSPIPSINSDLGMGDNPERAAGGAPGILSFVLRSEPPTPPAPQAAAAPPGRPPPPPGPSGAAGMPDRPSLSCAPSTPTCDHSPRHGAGGAAGGAAGPADVRYGAPPLVRSLPPDLGCGADERAHAADRLQEMLRSQSPRQLKPAAAAVQTSLQPDLTKTSFTPPEAPWVEDLHTGAVRPQQGDRQQLQPGSLRQHLLRENGSRPMSACESGTTGTQRLLNTLTTLRSVSFHLEKVQTPRGASKLAPIIASVHDRLKAAQAVQMAFSRSESRKVDLQSIKLLQEIGQGGYGTVYRGTYHGAEVAVKIIKQSRLAGVHSSSNVNSSAGLGLNKQHLHDAIELVASVSMSHINIVQVPAYFMDVRLDIPNDLNELDSMDQPHQPTKSRPFRLMYSPSLLESPAPGQDGHGVGEGAMALVLEYCDFGSLCDAIMDRKFIEKVTPRGGGAGGVSKTYLAINMRSVYSTLLEIALALRHMHSLALVHCDLKPQNVLLKSSPRDPRGFTAKLSDFGLAKMMEHNDHGQLVIDEAVASGTITHVAPEVLLGQSSLGAAVDIYAFGILMYQTLCGMKVYDRNMTPSGIANAVAHRGMRPQMPSWAPQNYRALAKRCWSHDPAERPTADELVQQLEGALEAKHFLGRQQPDGQSPPRQHPPPPPLQQQQQQQQPTQAGRRLATRSGAPTGAGLG